MCGCGSVTSGCFGGAVMGRRAVRCAASTVGTGVMGSSRS